MQLQSGEQSIHQSLASVTSIYVNQVYVGNYCSFRLQQQFQFYDRIIGPLGATISELPLFIGNFNKPCGSVGYTGQIPQLPYQIMLESGITEKPSSADQPGIEILKMKNSCCFRRPKFNIIVGGQQIGEIIYDFSSFLNMMVRIFVGTNNEFYIKPKSLCQLGLAHQQPCCFDMTIVFNIYDVTDNQVAQIIRTTKNGCVKGEPSNNYIIEFPNGISSESKAILMASVIVLDRTYFYERQCK